MRSFLFCIFILASLTGFSQNRVEISGEISVPESVNVGRITVFNITSENGTVTDDSGNFSIVVAVSDSLVFSSVQFQPFTVIVDKGVVDSKSLNVEVGEAVTELAQVIVRPYDLTGNVKVDVAKVVDSLNYKSQFSQEQINYSVGTPEVENYALNNDEYIEGLNLINLFKLVFNDKNDVEGENKVQEQPVDVLIRRIYKDEFFQKYMGIEQDKIDDFINYAEKEGLSHEMFEKGKELDLIEFLIEKSEEFKRQNP
jgi:hypothetical protein